MKVRPHRAATDHQQKARPRTRVQNLRRAKVRRRRKGRAAAAEPGQGRRSNMGCGDAQAGGGAKGRKPVKPSSSWFGSKTKRRIRSRRSAPPPDAARPRRRAPNLGSATSFGISFDGVSMVVNVPKGVKAGESVNVDVPLPTERRARGGAGAGCGPRRARTGAGARGRLVRLVRSRRRRPRPSGVGSPRSRARPAGGRGRAAAVGAQETRRDVARRAERHDARDGAALRRQQPPARRAALRSPAGLGSAEEFGRRPTTSWSRRSASSTCSTSSR